MRRAYRLAGSDGTTDAHGEGALLVVARDARPPRLERPRVGDGVVAVRLQPVAAAANSRTL